jgi:hypothetical protein
MNMKSFCTSSLWLITTVLLTGMVVAQNSSVKPVPDCGRPEIENGTLFIVNSCNITVSAVYTSSGDLWGGSLIGPGQHLRTAYSSEAVNRVRGVSVYTCPGYATPEEPDGAPIINHYTGREYRCHGSERDQTTSEQLNHALQPSQTLPQQVQQPFSNPTPNPWSGTVTVPADSDGVVQQTENTQEDDDEDQNVGSNQDENGIDLQQYQQVLQGIINTMSNNSVQRVAPAPAQGRPSPGCTQYCWK